MVVNAQSTWLSEEKKNDIPVHEQYGKLITARFYGPAATMKKHNIFNIFIIITGPLGIIAFLLYPLFIVHVLGYIILSLFICFIFFILVQQFQDSRQDPVYRNLKNKGTLDYDLYENGILEKTFTKNTPGNIVINFIPFRNISEVIFSTHKNNLKYITELTYDKTKWENPKQREDLLVYINTLKRFQKPIWLIIKGKPKAMETTLFKDIHSFKEFLKRKVKVVN
jgi:hypothetical protein